MRWPRPAPPVVKWDERPFPVWCLTFKRARIPKSSVASVISVVIRETSGEAYESAAGRPDERLTFVW